MIQAVMPEGGGDEHREGVAAGREALIHKSQVKGYREEELTSGLLTSPSLLELGSIGSFGF